MNTKIRTTIITLTAAASIATATFAPAISQAQPIDRSGGIVATKMRQLKNNPCPQLLSNYNNAQGALLDAVEKAKSLYERTIEETNAANVREAEGNLASASIAAWEYGCFGAASETPPARVVAPVTGITSTPPATTKPVVAANATRPVTALG